jgi:hypothetical protein
MKIREITSQSRRDFLATLECESCSALVVGFGGYDDDNFHRNVIPDIPCKICGKKSPDTYRPLTTKHAAGEVV